jgi:hypothetical protein
MPRWVDRRGVIEEALVHLLDEPLVRAELGGRERRDRRG